MKTRNSITQNYYNSYVPVSAFKKRPFCSDHFELCNFKRVERKQLGNMGCLELVEGKNIAFWLYLYKITRTFMSSLWAATIDREIIPYKQSKCIIQRCKQ